MEIAHTKYLQFINSPDDLKKLSIEELVVYCEELRNYIIAEVAVNPGHFGSSLGAVEIAVALHYVYDTPSDKLVWDVGHQAYAHKIITGRRDAFPTNRKMNGISGFPKMEESEYDSFGAGHSSTSISAALGLAIAARLDGSTAKSVAIIGDGAMTGGLAFEGLNNSGAEKANLLVVFNDNNCSIDPSVGALKEYFLEMTTSKHYNSIKTKTWNMMGSVPRLRRILQKMENGAKSFFLHSSNFFESLGFRYFGPTDGNDVVALVRRLKDLKQIDGPKLFHIYTVKGKGYRQAEQNQTAWHAPGVFDIETGEKSAPSNKLRFQEVFGNTLVELARDNSRIVGITPAMPTGCSLNIMMESMPERAFDVGIAEGHAVTFSAGLAAAGKLPFCNIYSSFSQRAIDNVIHDIALQKLEVVMCLDRAGLVGEDGATHNGLFDVALFRSVPNVIIAAPADAVELRNMMYTASLGGYKCCFVIRYPRGGSFDNQVLNTPFKELPLGKSRCISSGSGSGSVAILSLGNMYGIATQAADRLGAAHYDLRFAKPLDTQMLDHVGSHFESIIVVEDGVSAGGVGSAILEYYAGTDLHPTIKLLGVGDQFVEHATVAQQMEMVDLTIDAIMNCAEKLKKQ